MAAAAGSYTQDGRIGQLQTDLGKDKLLLISLTATERLSESYTVTIEAFSQEPQPVHTLLGTSVGAVFSAEGNSNVTRDFAGVLWEYSELGRDDRGYVYRLLLRPKTEFMTINRRSRIFQKKSVSDIIKAVIGGGFDAKLEGSYEPVEYCVQYQESDFDFVSRLMEYEGIYYFYEHKGTESKMLIVDQSNAHVDLAPASVKVYPRDPRRPDAPIWSVTERRGIGPAKVSVTDYDFELPATDYLKSKSAAKTLGAPTARNVKTEEGSASSWQESAEIYHYPGKIINATGEGAEKGGQPATSQRYSELWLDAQRRRMARSFAEGGLFAACVGRRLKLEYENNTSTEYLIVGTTHDYAAPAYDSGDGKEVFLCTLELAPAADQYRPAMVTQRPRIMGPQTALVVGPTGEEIYTDKYGRIKVQFYWDREGKKDDNTSCFVRVVQPVAGQSWGAFALPRMGQEVVVEFLEGDPDRPLITGAVYNANNMPPVDLPANKTQHGLRTRSSMGGGGFNHWWYEDKKGEEVAWFRAERDYKAHIVNADEERQYDKGNRKTTFLAGNDELFINKGTRTETICGNDSKTITDGDLTDIVKKGDETHTVEKGKRTTAIEQDEALEVKKGNRATKISMGNDSLKVALGNIDTKADLGKISIEAMQSIELKVGGSSITIDQVGVKIKGTVMVDISGVMVQSKGDAMHIVKGGLVLIN